MISAKADLNGRKVSLGTSLEGPLIDLRALMAAEEAQCWQLNRQKYGF